MNINIMGVLVFLFLLVTLGRAATPLTYESEFSSVIPPAKLFKATVLDNVNFISKIGAAGIKSVESLEGNGGVGTLKKITFSGQGGHTSFAMEKIESIDKDNLAYSYSLIEGENLGDEGLEKITYEIKYVAASGGGTTIKCVSKYFPKFEKPGLGYELDVQERKRVNSLLFNLVDKYLLANPDSYN